MGAGLPMGGSRRATGGGGGGMAISALVSGGTSTCLLYVDSLGQLAQSANLTWDESTKTLTALGTSGGPTLIALEGAACFGDAQGYVRGMSFNTDQSGAVCYWGDVGGFLYGTSAWINDDTQKFWVGAYGGETFVVDLANSKTYQNVKHETSDNITITANGKGLHQQSPNGHYHRLDVSDASAGAFTDIGTVPP